MPRRGYKQTPEHKRNNALTRTGRTQSDTHKAALADARKLSRDIAKAIKHQTTR